MAEQQHSPSSPSHNNQSITKKEVTVLECIICANWFHPHNENLKPRLLLCGHCFCTADLKQLIKNGVLCNFCVGILVLLNFILCILSFPLFPSLSISPFRCYQVSFRPHNNPSPRQQCEFFNTQLCVNGFDGKVFRRSKERRERCR